MAWGDHRLRRPRRAAARVQRPSCTGCVPGDHAELVGERVDLAAPCRAGVAHDGEDAYHRGPLQVLRQAGLVSARKDGTKVYYRLAGSNVAALWAELRDVDSTHLANVDRVRGAYLGRVAYVCHFAGWLADSLADTDS